MAINSYTAYLDDKDWDFRVGADGNLKMRSGAEGIAQNVSCEGKCFKDGCLYYADHGLEWMEDTLGAKFQKSLIAVYMRETALATQGVKSVESVTIDALDLATRTVTGEIIIKTIEDENVTARI